MLKLEKIGYSLKDVTIIPKTVSSVRHRGDVDPYTVVCGRKMLPIFVAPMAAVTDEFNYHIWLNNKVTPVLPRSVMERLSLEERLNIAEETFVAISLSEAEEFAEYEIPKDFNKKYWSWCCKRLYIHMVQFGWMLSAERSWFYSICSGRRKKHLF